MVKKINDNISIFTLVYLNKFKDKNFADIQECRIPFHKGRNLVTLKVAICVEDWLNEWKIKDFNLWVLGNNLKEIEKNIDEYFEQRTLDYKILSQNIKQF